MKLPSPLLKIVALAALLPVCALAAKDGKPRRDQAAAPDPAKAEMLKGYDKNGNHKIDPDELVAMQKAFSELRKLDKNSNGEIEASEVEPPKEAAASDRRSRAMAALKKIDRNGNQKIDDDEVAALQKSLSGGRMMKRLDQNGDGKLEPNEVKRLNDHIAAGGFRRESESPGIKSTPPPATSEPEKEADKPANAAETKKAEPKKAEPKKAEPKKDEPKKDEPKDLTKDPFLPKAGAKPPGNFGN